MLRISIPGTLQGAVRSAANLLLMSIVTSYGVYVLAAYGIGLRLDLIAMMPGWALGGAAATLVGQNLGAGEPIRAARSAWAATALYAALLLLLGTVFLIIPKHVIEIFNTQSQIVEHGSRYLRLRSATYMVIVQPFFLFFQDYLHYMACVRIRYLICIEHGVDFPLQRQELITRRYRLHQESDCR
jgi:Na+-driven multidrug efflux pump